MLCRIRMAGHDCVRCCLREILRSRYANAKSPRSRSQPIVCLSTHCAKGAYLGIRKETNPSLTVQPFPSSLKDHKIKRYHVRGGSAIAVALVLPIETTETALSPYVVELLSVMYMLLHLYPTFPGHLRLHTTYLTVSLVPCQEVIVYGYTI